MRDGETQREAEREERERESRRKGMRGKGPRRQEMETDYKVKG